MRILVQICRFLVGALFIFSGLIKANDPVGFGVKLEDYFLVFADTFSFFRAPWLLQSTVPLAWVICVVEVALGIALLLGIRRKLVAWSLLLMIIFFTWLTGYSAITGAVTDCGCFGDAIPLTPLQSFKKDLILLALILVIFVDVMTWPKVIKPILPGAIRWGIFALVTGFSAWVGIHALRHLPLIDFRHYKVGVNIQEGMELGPDARPEIVELTWVYKNKASGEIKEFIDVLPEDLDAWEFKDRTERLVQKGDEPPIHDFVLNDELGKDRTSFILNMDDTYLFFISPELAHTNVKAWKELNTLQQKAEAEGLHVFGLVGSGRQEIDAFRHEVQAAYPFYGVDLKALKTFIRADPGVVVMRKGTILAKYGWRDVPDYQELKGAFFADREPRPLADLSPGNFSQGQNVAALIEDESSDMAGFTLYNSGGDDVTKLLLNSDTLVWVLVRDVFNVKLDDWNELLPELKGLEARGLPYAVMTGSDELDLLPMRDASGLSFDYYFSDPDYFASIEESNIGMLVLVDGKVVQRWPGGALPDPSSILQSTVTP
jgi:uncharacterized membrane protein YphA (DoxX/SURF4 family)